MINYTSETLYAPKTARKCPKNQEWAESSLLVSMGLPSSSHLSHTYPLLFFTLPNTHAHIFAWGTPVLGVLSNREIYSYS